MGCQALFQSFLSVIAITASPQVLGRSLALPIWSILRCLLLTSVMPWHCTYSKPTRWCTFLLIAVMTLPPDCPIGASMPEFSCHSSLIRVRRISRVSPVLAQTAYQAVQPQADGETKRPGI